MSTTPEQRTLTRGSHWVRIIDAANWIYHFGVVSFVADRLELMTHNLDSTVISRLNRDGWTETVHASEVWPISQSLYFAMAKADWDVRNMSKATAAYLELTMVYSKLLRIEEERRRHQRRDFAWFLKEVEDIAWLAAASGYKGFNRINDRRVLLRFDKAAHAQGVDVSLSARGLRTARVYPSALDVLDRSEA